MYVCLCSVSFLIIKQCKTKKKLNMHWLQSVCIFAEWERMYVWITIVRVHWIINACKQCRICFVYHVKQSPTYFAITLHDCLVSELNLLPIVWATSHAVHFCLHLSYNLCWSLTSKLYIFKERRLISSSLIFVFQHTNSVSFINSS